MTSIREIARKAGVSPATVSRVLNRDKTFSIKDSTRQKVLNLAKSLHYELKPNRPSSGPKRKIIVLCALSVETLNRDLYFSDIKKGLYKEADISHITIVNFIHFPDSKFRFSDLKKFDGIIVIGTFTSNFLEHVSKYNTNVVIINEPRDFEKFDLIRNNYYSYTNKILDLLFKRNFYKIALIGGAVNQMDCLGLSEESCIDSRSRAYRNWMKSHDLPIQEIATDWTLEAGFNAMEKLLSTKNTPEIVIASSDLLAVGAYRAIHLHQLKIPDDIQLISFNNSEVASYLVPSLSSVSAPTLEMGEAAIRLLNDRFINQRTQAWQVVLPSKFIERESSYSKFNDSYLS